MRRVFAIFSINLLFLQFAFACHCTNISFNDYTKAFSESLNKQAQALGQYQGSIIKHTQTIIEQNKSVESQNALLKENLVKKKELIFYLKQKIEME